MVFLYGASVNKRRLNNHWPLSKFGTPGCPQAFDKSFFENVMTLVRNFGGQSARVHIEGVREWSFSLEDDAGAALTLQILEEQVNASKRPHCDPCRLMGWGHHPVCTSRFHFIIRRPRDLHRDGPGRGQKACPQCGHLIAASARKCSTCSGDAKRVTCLDDQSHLLHGCIHANGFGHLLRVSGREVTSSRAVRGAELMGLWDRLCTMLKARSISVEDAAWKRGLELRLLYACGGGRTWYGRWGYEFGRGSYGIGRKDYEQAVEKLMGAQLSTLSEEPAFLQLGVKYQVAPPGSPGAARLSDLVSRILDLLDPSWRTSPPPSPAAAGPRGHSWKRAGDGEHAACPDAPAQEAPARVAPDGGGREESTAPSTSSRGASVSRCHAVGRSCGRVTRASAQQGQPHAESPSTTGDAADRDAATEELKKGVNKRSCDIPLELARPPKQRTRSGQTGACPRGHAPRGQAPLDTPPAEKQEARSLPAPLFALPREELWADLQHINSLLLGCQATLSQSGGSSVEGLAWAVQVVRDTKLFGKDYAAADLEAAPSGCLRVLTVLSMRRPFRTAVPPRAPPPLPVQVPATASVAELKKEAQRAWREVYILAQQFTADSCPDLEAKGARDDDLVTKFVKDGDMVTVSGCGLSTASPSAFEGGAEDWEVRCVCGVQDDDGERMLACDLCGVWQHTRCMGFAPGEAPPESFMCATCTKGSKGRRGARAVQRGAKEMMGLPFLREI